MKKLFLLLSLVLLSATVHAQSKIGTIDTDYILAQMPQMEKVNQDLEKYQTELKTDFENSVKNYKELVAVYQEVSDTLSEEEKIAQENEIISVENGIKGFQQKAGVLIQLKRNELTKPLYILINDAMLKVIKTNGYTQILHAGASGLAYSGEEFDITLEVLNEMGIEVTAE